MSISRQGITLECGQCTCRGSGEQGYIEVDVPVSDARTGASGRALLHCNIAADCHRVRIEEWHDIDRQAGHQTPDFKQRLSAALDFVAKKRICGNRNICPTEVSRVAGKQGQD